MIVVSFLRRPWAESQRTKAGVPVTQQCQALPFQQGMAAQVSELIDTQDRGTGATGEGGMRAECRSFRAQQQSLINGCPFTTALCEERCCGSVAKTGEGLAMSALSVEGEGSAHPSAVCDPGCFVENLSVQQDGSVALRR